MPAAVVPLLPEYAKDRWTLRGRLIQYEGGTIPFEYQWFRLACVRPFTVTVNNIVGLTTVPGLIAPIRLLVYNRRETVPPPVFSNRFALFAPLGVDIVTPQSFIYDAPFEWITAVTTASGDPTAVDLVAG